MNRRELLKFLPGAAVVPAIFSLPSKSVLVSEQWRGFSIFWSGWIKAYDQHLFFGHWIAQNPNKNKMSVYSAYPGRTEKCWPGQIFDLSVKDGQEFPGPFHNQEQLDSFREDAFARLLDYIDKNYDMLVGVQ